MLPSFNRIKIHSCFHVSYRNKENESIQGKPFDLLDSMKPGFTCRSGQRQKKLR